jgi:hypothetical protein
VRWTVQEEIALVKQVKINITANDESFAMAA